MRIRFSHYSNAIIGEHDGFEQFGDRFWTFDVTAKSRHIRNGPTHSAYYQNCKSSHREPRANIQLNYMI